EARRQRGRVPRRLPHVGGLVRQQAASDPRGGVDDGGPAERHGRRRQAHPGKAAAQRREPARAAQRNAGWQWFRGLHLLAGQCAEQPVDHRVVSTSMRPSGWTRRVTCPLWSVRRMRTPCRSSLSITAGAGCPYRLRRPSERSAMSGSTAASSASEVEVLLPWCPTLSTAARSAAPCRATRRSSTAAGASPVNNAAKRPYVSLKTTEKSFAAAWPSSKFPSASASG